VCQGIGEGYEVGGDYYGVLHEVVCLEYMGELVQKCVLFNCEWFDPFISQRLCYPKLTLHRKVNHSCRYKKFDPFIFTNTATQVVYPKYSKGILGEASWWVAAPNKSRASLKSKDYLERGYQGNKMRSMNVDNVIAAMLVDDTALLHEVDEHDEGESHHGEDDYDNDEYKEEELRE